MTPTSYIRTPTPLIFLAPSSALPSSLSSSFPPIPVVIEARRQGSAEVAAPSGPPLGETRRLWWWRGGHRAPTFLWRHRGSGEFDPAETTRPEEAYKLFWPDQPEFVRMAARFGATIVPFGTVGEDDTAELVLDYNDQMKIPFLKKWIEKHNEEEVRTARLRTDMDGEISKQDMHYPIVAPKVLGRFYYLFGRPYETRGMDPTDRDSATEMYLRIKSDVECSLSYLKKKREEDPYRSIVQRTIYQNSRGSASEIPTFEP